MGRPRLDARKRRTEWILETAKEAPRITGPMRSGRRQVLERVDIEIKSARDARYTQAPAGQRDKLIPPV